MIPPVGPENEKFEQENVQRNNDESSTNINTDMSNSRAFVWAFASVAIGHIFGIISMILLRKWLSLSESPWK